MPRWIQTKLARFRRARSGSSLTGRCSRIKCLQFIYTVIGDDAYNTMTENHK